MSGIDKLYIKLPKTRISRSAVRGISLRSVLYTAASAGHQFTTWMPPREKKQVMRLINNSGVMISYEGYYNEASSYENFINHLIINPSRFASYEAMHRFLVSIDDGWLYESEITRMDFAVDYAKPINEFLLWVDFTRTHSSKIFIEDNHGRVETFYTGKHPDVLCIYDRNAFFADMRWAIQRPELPIVRMERQLRTSRALNQLIGQQLRFQDLESFFQRLARREYDVFSHRVNLHHFVENDRTSMNEEQKQRLDTFKGVALTSSYGRARRWAKYQCNDNYSRVYAPLYTRRPVAHRNQPLTILSRATDNFLRQTCFLPRPRSSDPPLNIEPYFGIYT